MTKKQHYVPKFYLRNFSKDGKTIGNYRLKKQQYIGNASIKSVAYRDFLYDDDNIIEKELAVHEKKWKEIIDMLLGRVNKENKAWNLFINEPEQILLYICEFIAVMEARTTKAGDGINYFYHFMRERYGMQLEERVYNNYFGDEEFCKHPNILLIQVAIENMQFYQGLKFHLIYNETKTKFITSDSPVLNLNYFYAKRKYKFGFGLKSMGLQKLIVISPNICICLYDTNVYRTKGAGMYRLKSEQIADSINKLIVKDSYEQIFFCNDMKKEYIRKISLLRRECETGSAAIVYRSKEGDELIQFHKECRNEILKLPFIKLKFKTLFYKIPNNLEGLIRPETKKD